MITIEWGSDRDIVQKIMKHDYVWPWVSDDTININDYQFPEIDNCIVRVAMCYNVERNILGCFIFFEKSEKVTEIHTCMLPAAKGMAKNFGDQVMNMIFRDSDYEIVETIITDDNPLAKKLAERCGFARSRDCDPIIRNGNLIKSEVWEHKKCQQQYL